MAIREDLVSSAVTFLQDHSVASAPIDRRVAFLQSKNLTQEEIDAALARAGDSAPGSVAIQTNYTPQSQQVVQRAPPQAQVGQYAGYSQWPADWQQHPPPPVPRRDWRDYFIMATLMSGVGYGFYTVAKRYIYPMIAPPTPPQLEQDKASVDEAFERAFSLIEQLSNDTANIKASEQERTEKLDGALADFEKSVSELKEASRKRDDDTRRLADDMRGIQDMIPRAMKAQEKNADERLKDLSQELKSLKTLLTNRVGATTPTPTTKQATSSGTGGHTTNGTPSGSTPPPSGTSTQSNSNPDSQQDVSNPLARFSAGKGGIPSWQMAASKSSTTQEKQQETSDTVNSTGVNNST